LILITQLMKREPTRILKEAEQKLQMDNQNLLRVLKSRNQSERQIIEQKYDLINRVLKNRILNVNNRLTQYAKFIEGVSPINTLRRGFSITRDKDGVALQSIAGLKSQEALITEVLDGKIESTIQKWEKRKE